MAKTARNLVNGSGTVSTMLNSENLTFSQSQDLLWGAAVVLSDGQQFTIRDGAGTAWVANQRATATASGKTFTTSDATTSRARGSGPVIVNGLHYLYIAPVDDQGNADGFAYYDTLVPNEDGRHPYTRDEYSGQKFYQEEPPGDFMVPPRYRWWDDFATAPTFHQLTDTSGNIVAPAASDVCLKDELGGVLQLIANSGLTPWTPFAGPVWGLTPRAFKSFRLAKRPVLHVRFALFDYNSFTGKRRIGFMTIPAFSGTDVEPSSGVFFRHDRTGNIYAVARKNDVKTTVDTGVSVSNGVHHMAQLISRLNGTAVEVWVDAVMKGLLTTNLPVPTTDLYFLFHQASGVGEYVDYYYVEADRPS
jgi:hypothetical protein